MSVRCPIRTGQSLAINDHARAAIEKDSFQGSLTVVDKAHGLQWTELTDCIVQGVRLRLCVPVKALQSATTQNRRSVHWRKG